MRPSRSTRKRESEKGGRRPYLQSLSAEIVVGADGEARMQVEAMARDGFVSERTGGLSRAFALARVVFHVLELAALRGELGEHLGERAVGRVVRGVVVVLGVPALAKPRHHAQRHSLGEDVELRATRRGCRHEARVLAFLAFDVDAVERARVQMDVQIQARAEALDERDGARVKLAALAALLRRLLVEARELLGVDARERPKHLGLRRCEQRQLEREGQDELPNRHRWQDAVDEVRRLRSHTPPCAARTQAAIFTQNGTSKSCWHREQRRWTKPREKSPQRKYPRSSSSTYRGSGPSYGLTCVAKELCAVLLHETIKHRPMRLARQIRRREPGHGLA